MNGKTMLNIGHKYQRSHAQLCHKSWHLLIHRNILQTSQKIAKPHVDNPKTYCGTKISIYSSILINNKYVIHHNAVYRKYSQLLNLHFADKYISEKVFQLTNFIIIVLKCKINIYPGIFLNLYLSKF